MMSWMLLFIMGMGAVRGFYELSQVAVEYMHSMMGDDAMLYLLVGRGLLNGLVPYIDLYESKPPGMFMFSALSLMTTGDQRLMTTVHIVGLYGAPLTMAYAAWRYLVEKGERIFRIVIPTAMFCIGALLVLYLETRASGLQTEFFGALWGTIYVMLFFLQRKYSSWSSILWKVPPLFLAVFFKEPFLLITGVAALLLSRSFRQFWWGYVVPMGFAGALEVALLGMMGWLGPYVRIHLPIMLWERPDIVTVPPMIQAIDANPLWLNLTAFFPSLPLLGWLVGILWILTPFFRSSSTRPWDGALFAATGTMGFLFLSRLMVLVAYAWLSSQHFILTDRALLSHAVMQGAVLGPVVAALLVVQWRRGGMLTGTVCSFLALYIVSYTILVSGVSGRHFSAVGPVYVALALLFLEYWATSPRRPLAIAISSLFAISLMFYRQDPVHVQFWVNNQKNGMVSSEKRAAFSAFDDLLDACHINRFIGPFKASIFGRHALWGPLPTPQNFSYLPPDHPLLLETQENSEKRNQVILREESVQDQTIPNGFTTDAPPCAAPYIPIQGHTVLFRKSTDI